MTRIEATVRSGECEMDYAVEDEDSLVALDTMRELLDSPVCDSSSEQRLRNELRSWKVGR